MKQKSNKSVVKHTPHKNGTWDKVRNYGQFDNWMDWEKKHLHQVQPIIRNKPN